MFRLGRKAQHALFQIPSRTEMARFRRAGSRIVSTSLFCAGLFTSVCFPLGRLPAGEEICEHLERPRKRMFRSFSFSCVDACRFVVLVWRFYLLFLYLMFQRRRWGGRRNKKGRKTQDSGSQSCVIAHDDVRVCLCVHSVRVTAVRGAASFTALMIVMIPPSVMSWPG